MSIDGFGIGASFGMSGTKITKSGYAAVFGITFLILKLSVLSGKALCRIIPEDSAVFAGYVILMAVGIYLIFQEIKENNKNFEKRKNSMSTQADSLHSPRLCDIDNSGSIEMLEAVFLAAVLCADSFGAGLGLSAIYEDLGILPVLMAVFQCAFLHGGLKTGNKLGERMEKCRWKDFLPGIVLIVLGIAGINTGGKLI